MSTLEAILGAYHHGNLRQALIDGAKDLIAEQGPDGFTLRELARRVGVSHTAAYRHFADKDALLAAVAGEGFRRLGEAFTEALGSTDDPRDAFAATGLAYVRFAAENPGNFKVMFRMADCLPELTAIAEASGSSKDVLRGQIEALQQAGLIREGPVEVYVLAAWSLVHGLARLLVDGVLDPDEVGAPEVVAKQVTDVLFAGLGVPS